MWKEVGLGCSWLYQPGLSKVSDKIGPAGFETYRHHLICIIIIDYDVKLLSVYKLGDKRPRQIPKIHNCPNMYQLQNFNSTRINDFCKRCMYSLHIYSSLNSLLSNTISYPQTPWSVSAGHTHNIYHRADATRRLAASCKDFTLNIIAFSLGFWL